MLDIVSALLNYDAMDTIAIVPDAHPDKPLLYSSPLIIERRRRLLRETRHMIAEEGLEGFSVRKLCTRAGVAQRTLYNAFHNKDRLIALAIREAYDEFHRYVRYKTDKNALAGVLDRLISVNRRNFRVRNYTRAVVSIYFSPTTPRDIWQTLQDMSLIRMREWLTFVRESGQMEPWVNIEHLSDLIANMQYAVINDWCNERIPDDEYLVRLVEGMLLLVIGSMRGALHEEARDFLQELQRTGTVPAFPNAIWSPPPRETVNG